jgi:hypothetical protein
MRQHREAVCEGSPREERRGRGQPPIFGVPLTRTIEIRVTEEQFRDLHEVASAEGKGVSTLLRDAADSYVGDFRERRMFFIGKKSYTPE